jgi:hypothetical protein
MKFVGNMSFVHILTMCRFYTNEREVLVKNCFILLMAMLLACMSLSILLAMLVLKLWLSCLSMSQF